MKCRGGNRADKTTQYEAVGRTGEIEKGADLSNILDLVTTGFVAGL